MAVLRPLLVALLISFITPSSFANGILVKDLTRVKGVRENIIVGYGLVTGLAGTGDSSRSHATVKSLGNTLERFGLQLTSSQIRSRNVAAVTLTATLPAYAQEGDQLDVIVSSIGDARSLVGGTLLMTELKGPDQKIYAIAQGPLTVGGYKHEQNGNVIQKNHPTSARITNGATIEKDVLSNVFGKEGRATLILKVPDMETSFKIADAINNKLTNVIAKPQNAANIELSFSAQSQVDRLRELMKVDKLSVTPSNQSKVVINERTGTVVYGGSVKLGAVSITHGEIKIVIDNDTKVIFPENYISVNSSAERIPDATLSVAEASPVQASFAAGSSVTDLIYALNKMDASSQDVISILQAIKGAGALHAEVIVQ